MNFENYNKIYQEILDDENDQLSSNYLLNKYQIKHDEELINILNQIKKNEYISSDNKVLNRLLSELDEDEDLLNINEIIEIKEKVISDNFYNEDFVDNEDESKLDFEKNNINERKNELNNNKKISNILDNIKINFNIKYSIIILFGIFILSSFYFIDFTEKSSEKITKKEVASSLEVEKQIDEKIEKNVVEKQIDEKIEKNIDENKLVNQVVENTQKEDTTSNEIEETIDNKFSKIEDIETQQNDSLNIAEKVEPDLNIINTQNSITLDSLEEIEKYKDQLIYDNGKLVFNEIPYGENDTLFGFKIYKLTSVYVKFQDEKNQLRKRILLNN
ncbi:hypothetical protein ACMC56_05660 [Campylobacterota bacterium DY0563]